MLNSSRNVNWKKIYHRVETWRDFFANKFHFEYYNYSLECWDFIFLLFRNPPWPYDRFLCLGSRGTWLDRVYWVGRGTFFFITIQGSISCYISDRWKYIHNTVIALKNENKHLIFWYVFKKNNSCKLSCVTYKLKSSRV